MLISVIIPVYNVQNYLRACLDSVLNQTFKDFEIIAVDDGSTDGSGAILDEYAARDDRLIVIHQQNAGVSAARNAGLEQVRGEYFAFVDSDDYLDTDYFATSATVLLEKRPTLLVNNYIHDEERTFQEESLLHSFEKEDFLEELLRGSLFSWGPVACFYQANAGNRLRFDSRFSFGEDLDFKYRFIRDNEGPWIHQPIARYHYVTRDESAVHAYPLHRKVEDLEVLEAVMSTAPQGAKHVAWVWQYLPRLAHNASAGSVLTDPRDKAALLKVHALLKRELPAALKDPEVSRMLKFKLLCGMLPGPLQILIRRLRDLTHHPR